MNLFSKLVVAASFSFIACDQNLDVSDAPAASATISALKSLGDTRSIVAADEGEAKLLMDSALASEEGRAALDRLRADGYRFDRVSNSAFWTVGNGDKLGTVIQRGVRDGEQVMVATVLHPDLSVVSTLELEGEGETFAAYELGATEGARELRVEEYENAVSVEASALIGYATGAPTTQCTLQNGIIDAGGQIADGLCVGEANFVCLWSYVGNTNAYNKCVKQRIAACAIGTDKWDAPVCN